MNNKPKLQLVGIDGNAYSILGAAVKAAKKAGWTQEMIADFKEEAMADDYQHLLNTVVDQFDVS